MTVKGYVVHWDEEVNGSALPVYVAADGATSPRREDATEFKSVGDAVEAAGDGFRTARIFAVAEDGTETPLQSYEQALAKLDAVCAAAEDVCSDYTEEGETKGPLSLRINRLMAALAARKART